MEAAITNAVTAGITFSLKKLLTLSQKLCPVGSVYLMGLPRAYPYLSKAWGSLGSGTIVSEEINRPNCGS